MAHYKRFWLLVAIVFTFGLFAGDAAVQGQQPVDPWHFPQLANSRFFQRWWWAFQQRAYPLGYLPPGVRETALRQAHAAALAQAQAALQTRVAELAQLKSTGKFITAELDAYRQRRIIRWLNRLLNRSDASNEIAPAFHQLKDDSFIFTKGLDGFLLQPSDNLQRVPFLYYPLDLGRAHLQGILLAPIVDFPLTSGMLGIELVSPSHTIVAQVVVPAHQISATAPTRFDFAPLRDSDQGRFWLRVFVRDVDMSVRIFEWRKYSMVTLGAVQTRAFCSFVF